MAGQDVAVATQPPNHPLFSAEAVKKFAEAQRTIALLVSAPHNLPITREHKELCAIYK
jgi:hypothetical protein